MHVFPARRFRRRQTAHFMICHVFPVMAIVALPLCGAGIRFDWSAAVLWVSMWCLTGGVGVSVGYHRHFAHHAFKAHPALRRLMAFCGGMAGQGPVMYWVALHRRHHSLSDVPGDPHSPNLEATQMVSPLQSFLQGHLFWAFRHDVPKPKRYTPDLMADPVAIWSSRVYPYALIAGIAIPAALGATLQNELHGLMHGAYWGGLVRIVVGHHLIWSVNSFGHALGHRSYNTADHSRNVAWLSFAAPARCGTSVVRNCTRVSRPVSSHAISSFPSSRVRNRQ